MSRRSPIITALQAESRQIEAFPYFAASFIPDPELSGTGDDTPLGASLSTPEEDAKRLASVDQIIHDRLQQAEQEAQTMGQKGYEDGFSAGEIEGRTFGESQYKSFIKRLDTHLAELSNTLALAKHASRDEILALAMAMAEYLMGQQIERSATSILPLLDSILEANPFPGASEGPIQAFLNPRDLETLQASSATLPAIKLLGDESLSRGSLRLESPDGVLDATLERRRAHLTELLQQQCEKDAL